MSLFQKSVEQKYLKQLDNKLIAAKYDEFKLYFGNPEIQENIRNSKEEQFQEGFFRELFVKILGYTLNPDQNFNLTTEYKNVKDSKKADGAILLTKEHAPLLVAVIELKGTNTTDLGKIEAQAFGYKNNQPDCVYVITSNFEKLRFYIDNAIEFIEFNLFKLTKSDFAILYLCLAYNQIAKGIPKKVKEESVSQEDVITKKLYSDYSLFKRELHQNLVSQNLQYDALTLFRKSQKLLDRFLFLFFAEDRQLLPPNSVRLVLNDWKDLQERDVEVPLYDRFKKYFGYLNTGYKGKRYDVFAYNGGLFKPDEILDFVTTDDSLLYKHVLKLSEYDFISEVDVNILGHIFENSLNELDELTRELAPVSKEKAPVLSRRKKDGVFYTPKYITKYIVENTVGKLCKEKKAELQFNEEDYNTGEHTSKPREQALKPREQAPLQKKKNKQALYDKLKTYQNWLLQLTICDPACGSGAFLNQALDFLIAEHRYIDELQAKLLGVPMILSDVEKSILENNLFGVDLNEESVEIAKLSLWLRTAQPNRKLNDLNNNIKCGNSLISDSAVAGDKAFDWVREFPQVFHQKQKRAWHITCATHNSRYSQRMFDNFVKLGEAVWLSEKEEEIVTQTLAKIVETDKLNIPAYNICGDHMHLILVCEEAELSSIVQKIKSMTARACNIAMGRTIPREHAPLASEHAPLTSGHAPASSPEPERGTAQAHLWTQKFGNKEITSEEQLLNTIEYIRNNRIKHGLPELGKTETNNKGACSLVTSPVSAPVSSPFESIVCSIDYAFRTEYKGGFDVVIGNPPYGAKITISEKGYYNLNYKTHFPNYDTYGLFFEKSYDLLIEGGYLGFITPNTYLVIENGINLRSLLFTRCRIRELLETFNVFPDAVVEPITTILSKELPKSDDSFFCFLTPRGKTFSQADLSIYPMLKFHQTDLLEREDLILNYKATEENRILTKKITNRSIQLSEIAKITAGVKPYEKGKGNPIQTEEIVLNKPYTAFQKADNNWLKLIRGTQVTKYSLIWDGEFIKYGDCLAAPRNPDSFLNPKIFIRRTDDVIRAAFDDEKIIGVNSIHCLQSKNENISLKFLLTILNSRLTNWFFQYQNFHMVGKPLAEVKVIFVERLPIVIANDQTPFIEKADLMLSLQKELQETAQKFQRTILRKFFPPTREHAPVTAPVTAPVAAPVAAPVLAAKLQNWYLLSYNEFIAELGKKKVKLSLKEEAEWEDYFLQEAEKAMEIKAAIESTDKEIDQMVYQLYGLTNEEIKIIEA